LFRSSPNKSESDEEFFDCEEVKEEVVISPPKPVEEALEF